MNIFISNLTYAITDGDLNDLFGEYGEVSSAKVIMDRETRKSRGFGFVEMSDDELAKKAIEDLDRAEYDGRIINVKEASPRPERAGGNRGGNRGGGRRF
ncbi:RNA recognition motif domain-containing protein [Carboxylicivirga sp. N1Y90]|uniref:RNA recognition motif domain-containing protein n=1 Tax=Carboxylicivirga fragile TaxID=3417571 RepID=UPI003D34292F|nr:RNA-binding protein [Marinilabiliaceae bacterium N1Y90]